ncbi:alpha/beta hydrolase [Spirillospora sp. CA-255316]
MSWRQHSNAAPGAVEQPEDAADHNHQEPKQRMNRRVFLGLGVTAGTLLSGTTSAAATTVPTAPDTGLTLLGPPVRLTARMEELTFTSSALGDGQTKVRVLLPDGYDPAHARRYPVLYLYHGGLENYTAWSDPAKGNAEELTTGLPMIAVMPDAGISGFYTNWFNNGAFGSPEWESYHVDQLIPWIDAHYRTIPHRSARATAGLSMGGHGSLAYAARHPDLIGIAASFSGAVDINHSGLAIRYPAQEAIAARIFGSYKTEEVRWRGTNTWDLAANLTNTDVSLYAGDNDATEITISECTESVHKRLDQLGIRHRFTIYPGLGHTWENFRRSFSDWLPHLMKAFSRRTAPRSFTVASISPQFTRYGWSVDVQRKVIEFSALEVAGSRDFTMIGSGSATVVTPPIGRPRAHYRVIIHSRNHRSTLWISACSEGRLTVPVPLGPGNPHQQYSPAADAASTGPSPDHPPFHVRGNGSRFYRTTVSIRAMRP